MKLTKYKKPILQVLIIYRLFEDELIKIYYITQILVNNTNLYQIITFHEKHRKTLKSHTT